MPGPGKPFSKGNAGGPGRPKVPSDFRESCRSYTPQAFARLTKEIEDDGPLWFKAAELLLAYGEGRPPQGIELSGEGGAPISIQIVRKGAK